MVYPLRFTFLPFYPDRLRDLAVLAHAAERLALGLRR